MIHNSYLAKSDYTEKSAWLYCYMSLLIFAFLIYFNTPTHCGIHLLINPSQSPSKNCILPTSNEILAITV
jgi:hypothetical protein